MISLAMNALLLILCWRSIKNSKRILILCREREDITRDVTKKMWRHKARTEVVKKDRDRLAHLYEDLQGKLAKWGNETVVLHDNQPGWSKNDSVFVYKKMGDHLYMRNDWKSRFKRIKSVNYRVVQYLIDEGKGRGKRWRSLRYAEPKKIAIFLSMSVERLSRIV